MPRSNKFTPFLFFFLLLQFTCAGQPAQKSGTLGLAVLGRLRLILRGGGDMGGSAGVVESSSRALSDDRSGLETAGTVLKTGARVRRIEGASGHGRASVTRVGDTNSGFS
jgi:hypothetical protein